MRQTYLDLLALAKKRGFSRQKIQTPYEYQASLEPNIPQVEAELKAVTEAFMEARYSTHEMTEGQVEDTSQQSNTVKAALQEGG